MSYGHTLSKTLTLPNGTQFANSVNITGGRHYGININVAANQTHHKVNITFDKDTLNSLIIACGNGNCTIKTNSSSSPADTIALTPSRPILWGDDAAVVVPLTADVTSIFITTGADSVTFRLSALGTDA